MDIDESSQLDDSQLSCLQLGTCGFKDLSDGSKVTDLAFEVHAEDAALSRDPTPNKAGGHDLIIHNARILSPGKRNQFFYPLESVKNTKHLKRRKDGTVFELHEMSSPFVTPHTSDPLKQIGRIENLRWDEQEQSIVGDPRIYDDPRLTDGQKAIALIERDEGFLSLSTRLKVQPYIENAVPNMPSVKNLLLIHVAWVDVGADPTAGKDLSNMDTGTQPNGDSQSPGTSPEVDSVDSNLSSQEQVDLALLPIADRNTKWDSGAAEKAVWAWSNRDGSKAGKAYFWKDPQGDPNLRQSYKLPFADVVNGTLTAIPAGIIGCYGAMQGARGGVVIPEADKATVLGKIKAYYDKMGMNWPLKASNQSDSAADSAEEDAPQTDTEVSSMSEEAEVQNTEPVAPPTEPTQESDSKNSQTQNTEAPVRTIADMSDDEEVTLTAGDLRRLKVELYEQINSENKRAQLMEEIAALAVEIPDGFLESLHSNEQLEWFKTVVDKLIAKITQKDNSIAELEHIKYRMTGEKPSLSAATDAENSADEVVKRAYMADPLKKYPVRARMMGKAHLTLPKGGE